MTDRELLEMIASKLDKLVSKVDKLESQVDKLESQTTENTQLLNALVHNSQEHKALLDQLNLRVASLEGKVETISKDLNFVEIATSKNMTDIAYLKAVK